MVTQKSLGSVLKNRKWSVTADHYYEVTNFKREYKTAIQDKMIASKSSKLTQIGANPCQTQCALWKISICEHVGEAVKIMVSQWIQIKKIANIDILFAERIIWRASITSFRSIYLQPQTI